MTGRIEYTGRGGEDNFTEPLLIGKTILAVYKDGVGASKIVKNVEPTAKQASYQNPTGNISFAETFEPGEPAIVLYKEGTVEDLCIEITIPSRALNEAHVGFSYASSFFVGGSTPITMSALVKPDWLTVDISGTFVTMTGTPSFSDEATGAEVSFTLTNGCSTADYSKTIDVLILPAKFGIATLVSEDRVDDTEIANLEGTPGVDVTVTLDTYTNTNGGKIKVNGSEAFGGNTWVVTLDSQGKGILNVAIEGAPIQPAGTTVIRGLFHITSVSAGTIDAANAYQISKIYT